MVVDSLTPLTIAFRSNCGVTLVRVFIFNHTFMSLNRLRFWIYNRFPSTWEAHFETDCILSLQYQRSRTPCYRTMVLECCLSFNLISVNHHMVTNHSNYGSKMFDITPVKCSNKESIHYFYVVSKIVRLSVISFCHELSRKCLVNGAT